MKVFVTGVGGQLGHDVVNKLTAKGHEAVESDIQPNYSGIQDPRNSLMHNKDINPDDKTTDALITSVREYLEFYQVALY